MLRWIASLSRIEINLTTTCKHQNFSQTKIYLEFFSMIVFAFKVKVAVKNGLDNHLFIPALEGI